jgi:hypothetical protein
MNYKRLFLNWLHKEGIYTIFFDSLKYSYDFIYECGGPRITNVVKYFKNKCANQNNPDAYVCTFIWGISSQGIDYWIDINNRWNLYLEKWKFLHKNYDRS